MMESDTVADYSKGDIGLVDGKQGDKGKVVNVEKDFAKPMEMGIISNNDMIYIIRHLKLIAMVTFQILRKIEQ